jgi:hypothetical protein
MQDFEIILGRAVFRLWPNLPRDFQELAFEASTVNNPDV